MNIWRFAFYKLISEQFTVIIVFNKTLILCLNF